MNFVLNTLPSGKLLDSQNMRQSDQLSQVFHALADPNRRRMLEAMATEEQSISDLAEHLSMSLVSVLKHLKVLADAGLIDQQKTGRVRHCRLEEGPLVDATVWLSKHTKYWQNQFETLAAFLSMPKDEEKKDDLWIKSEADRRPIKTRDRSKRADQKSKTKAGSAKSR